MNLNERLQSQNDIFQSHPKQPNHQATNNESEQIKLFQTHKHDNNKSNKLKQNPPQVTPETTTIKRVKFVLTFLTIILTSFQVYDITTNKLDHSRNFIRFLNYYLIQHTGFDIYWAGQYMVNYPINEYFQISQVDQFLGRFQDTMKSLDDNVYGFIDFENFLSSTNKIYLQSKQGQAQQFDYVIKEGFQQPFRLKDLDSIREAILSAQQIQIKIKTFSLNEHIWNIMVSITTFSESSIFVRIYAQQELSIWRDHITTFTMGLLFLLVLTKQYLSQSDKQARSEIIVDNIPEYLLCVFLVNLFFFTLSGRMNVEWLIILDGIQCLIAWLLILKFLQKQDDYHISFLIRKSYLLVGRLFVSFGPIFIAFTLFGYALFCREAWQFSTYKRTFLNLFYICYYNMTYESFIVTSRANPISMIFFFSFVILFTICVYSGMLVSVFCSYVWNKRQSKIKQDIINNLKIQCSQCDTKYKYIDCLEEMKKSKKSMRMSFIMQTDFSNSDERYKYKKAIQNKVINLSNFIQSLLQQNKRLIPRKDNQVLIEFVKKQFLQRIGADIKKFLSQQFIVSQYQTVDRPNKQKGILNLTLQRNSNYQENSRNRLKQHFWKMDNFEHLSVYNLH